MAEKIQYYNSQDAAKILGVNVSTVKRWTEDGKLECVKSAGGHRKFLMSHLADFLEKNKKKTSKANLFPLNKTSDQKISGYILSGDFDYLSNYILKQALACNREQIHQVLNGLYLAQYPLHQIYDKMITPAMHQIGELWVNNKISVAQEHLASQTLRDAIVRLQGIIRMPNSQKGKVFCLNLSDELHDIALKMVAHILEYRGFQVLFSGQLTPLTTIENELKLFRPKRVYLSSTFINDLKSAQSEFDQLCSVCKKYETEIYVGGQGINLLKIDHPAVKATLSNFTELANN